MAILEMKNISKAFAGVYANRNINLCVEKGEIHAILGENGAGKTTLVNILFGLYTPDGGEILWKGKKADFASPRDAIAAGIGMVHQHFSLVQKMSVMDNMVLGMKENGFILNRPLIEKRIMDLVNRYGLTVDPKARICDLSVGEQQRVEILKLLYREAELLILDEPTGVLTPQETEQFFEVLRSLKNEGYAIIIITHRMSEIMAISDRVTILRDGRQVADLITEKTNPSELSQFMIGRSLNGDKDILRALDGEKLLTMEHVSLPRRHRSHPLSDISLQLNKGEILGIAGVEGNGQKEFAEVITGIQKHSGGKITLNGVDIGKKSVKWRYEAGVAYISDDRHNDSLIVDMNITENLMLREYCHEPFSSHSILNRKEMLRDAERKIEKYQVKASGSSGTGTKVKLLSGGNQQKLIIARELSNKAKLIVASQPTRGLDIGATEFVREMLIEQRNAGKGVVLISADLEEIMAVSDRIAVLFGGRVNGILSRDEATVDRIGLMMGGITGEESAQ
jgi:general nucleoside transport system ATP-binding protein